MIWPPAHAICNVHPRGPCDPGPWIHIWWMLYGNVYIYSSMYTQTSSGLLRGGAAANVQMHRVLFICAELCRMCGPNVETFISILYIRTSRLALRHIYIAVASASSGALRGVPTAFRSTDKQQDLWREAATCKSSAWFDPGTKKQNIDNADQGNTHTHPRLSMCMPLGRLLVYLAVPAKHTRHTKMRASGEPRAGWPPQQTARCINIHRIHDCVHVIWNVHSYCCRQAARCI
jgi:hypothetical protein